MTDVEVCTRAIDTWGPELQLVVCMEEMAELTKELSKQLRGKGNRDNTAEEIADVEIMLEQLKIIFDFRKQVEEARTKKIGRLDRSIRYAKEGHHE